MLVTDIQSLSKPISKATTQLGSDIGSVGVVFERAYRAFHTNQTSV